MSLSFCSLASSSSGNCYYIENDQGTRILIDAGVPLRRMENALSSIGVDPASLSGIFITHAHRDHVASYLIKTPFATRYRIPSYASTGTWKELLKTKGRGHLEYERCHRLEPGQVVELPGMKVQGISKPHDAAGALCFQVSSETERVAVVTDLGYVTEQLVATLRGCDYLIFEANHDVELEMASSRPWFLKQRVLGDYGHLSNEQAAVALSKIAVGSRGVWLAHLSEECNCPDIARRAVRERLKAALPSIEVHCLPARSISPFYGSPRGERVESISMWEASESTP